LGEAFRVQRSFRERGVRPLCVVKVDPAVDDPFGVKFFDLAALVLNLFDLVRENNDHAFNRLSLPRTDLRWMKLALGCELLNSLVTTQRFMRRSCLKSI
jgi:hypothetical protein